MCDCIQQMNEQLKEHNTQLDTVISLFTAGPEKLSISTIKVDKKDRQGPVRVLTTFCPFCGEKHEFVEATDNDR